VLYYPPTPKNNSLWKRTQEDFAEEIVFFSDLETSDTNPITWKKILNYINCRMVKDCLNVIQLIHVNETIPLDHLKNCILERTLLLFHRDQNSTLEPTPA